MKHARMPTEKKRHPQITRISQISDEEGGRLERDGKARASGELPRITPITRMKRVQATGERKLNRQDAEGAKFKAAEKR
jgi:hypothetical protein